MLARKCTHTFNPYCNLAMMGLSAMKVKRERFMVYGRGTINMQKTDISNIRSPNTWRQTLVSACYWTDSDKLEGLFERGL